MCNFSSISNNVPFNHVPSSESNSTSSLLKIGSVALLALGAFAIIWLRKNSTVSKSIQENFPDYKSLESLPWTPETYLMKLIRSSNSSFKKTVDISRLKTYLQTTKSYYNSLHPLLYIR
jgi:hypothetical protein